MASATTDDFRGLALTGVTKLNGGKELGRGAYGRVYEVKYCGMVCAAKEIHSILIEDVGEVEMRRTVESFVAECRQCSTLRHPNIVQFLGVYFPPNSGTGRKQLPVMVMEMMADSLTSLVVKHENIPVHIKFSIVHDVSLGLCYLHNQSPPIVHRDLSPNNILLTVHQVAKISDLGVAKVIKTDNTKTMTKAPGTLDFMPPESLSTTPVYGPPMDVFSFAGIVLHTFNQEWPSPSDQVTFDPKTREMVALSEVKRREHCLNKMTGEAEALKPLVMVCLDNDPAVRPKIADVCEKIQVDKDAYVKEAVITLHKELTKTQVPKSYSTEALTTAIAYYKFESSSANELSLEEGDEITVTEKREDGWWRGTCGGQEGWFPGSYVKEAEISNVSNVGNDKEASVPTAEMSFKSKRWFHGRLQSAEVENLLRFRGNGHYLVREELSVRCTYIIHSHV